VHATLSGIAEAGIVDHHGAMLQQTSRRVQSAPGSTCLHRSTRVGVLIVSPPTGLVHYIEPEATFRLLERAATNRG